MSPLGSVLGRLRRSRWTSPEAVTYALSRFLVTALLALPLAAAGAYLYSQRGEPLERLASGWSAVALGAAAALGAVALACRRRLLDAVDRRFFRERPDAREILIPLAERIRDAGSARALAEAVCRGIDRALHPASLALLVDAPSEGRFVDPSGRAAPLDAAGPLLGLAAAGSEALSLEGGSSPALEGLSEEERSWLGEGDFELLVPVFDSEGVLAALLALGAKRSGLPFLKEDRRLLGSIAHSAGLALEVARLRLGSAAGREAGPGPGAAGECYQCGSLYPAHQASCVTCRRALAAACVPYVLPGRFRFEERIGAGGMGVVYRAVDLALNRAVAVKTLRRAAREDSLRLRREARAAAAVHHPSLAFIYGIETWHGIPMLLLEYLPGGTLEDRLEQAPLPAAEALGLAIALAGALENLHAASILHRDLKPSNIGFDREGTPKLMDFGIARQRFDARGERPGAVRPLAESEKSPDEEAWSELPTAEDATHHLAGTLHYLSPEAVRLEPAGPDLDLWSLNVVLFECLTGERLFRGPVREVMDDVANVRVPELGALLPDCPEPLAAHFAGALHADPVRRPGSARELRQELESLREVFSRRSGPGSG